MYFQQFCLMAGLPKLKKVHFWSGIFSKCEKISTSVLQVFFYLQKLILFVLLDPLWWDFFFSRAAHFFLGIELWSRYVY
jgi:hypothetical protein